MTVETIFGETNHISWWQEVARAVVIFIYGLTLVRLAGRRCFGKWAALDIIVSVIVGSNLSRTLTGGAPLGGTLAATTLLMALHWVLAHAAARSVGLSRLLEGCPIELGHDGEIDPKVLKRHAVSPRDLEEALRQANIDAVADTRLVTLEPSGKISVCKAK